MNKSVSAKLRSMCYTALFVVIITVCSWLSIPAPVPFTMQTFAVFSALLLLGGKLGTVSIVIYLMLGGLGVSVFSGFRGGLGALLGVTGGYLIGFILMALVYWLATAVFGNKTVVSILALSIGLILCYTFGTFWFVHVYGKNVGSIGFGAAFLKCVVPFIIPDIAKGALALFLSRRLSGLIEKDS